MATHRMPSFLISAAALALVAGCTPPDDGEREDRRVQQGAWRVTPTDFAFEGRCGELAEEVELADMDMIVAFADGELRMNLEGVRLRGEQIGLDLYAEGRVDMGRPDYELDDAPDEDWGDDDAGDPDEDDAGTDDSDMPPPCETEEPGEPGTPGGGGGAGPDAEAIWVSLDAQAQDRSHMSGEITVDYTGIGQECVLFVPFKARHMGEVEPSDEPVHEPEPEEETDREDRD